MKIIGMINDRYLVEATREELTKSAGYSWPFEVPGAAIPSQYSKFDASFPVGTQILVAKTHDYLGKLRENEDKVRQSETLLRALADMLHTALPTTIIPPEEKVIS